MDNHNSARCVRKLNDQTARVMPIGRAVRLATARILVRRYDRADGEQGPRCLEYDDAIANMR